MHEHNRLDAWHNANNQLADIPTTLNMYQTMLIEIQVEIAATSLGQRHNKVRNYTQMIPIDLHSESTDITGDIKYLL